VVLWRKEAIAMMCEKERQSERAMERTRMTSVSRASVMPCHEQTMYVFEEFTKAFPSAQLASSVSTLTAN